MKKLRFPTVLSFSFLLVWICVQSLEAGTAYVSSITQVTLRTEAGVQHRIVEMLKSGTQLEVIEYQRDWSRVRTPKGNEGWILSRFITEAKPKILLVDELIKKNQALTQELAMLKDDHQELARINGRLAEIEKKYTALKSESAEFYPGKKYNQIRKDFEQQTEQVRILEADLRNDKTKFMSAGLGVFILGLIFGIGTRKKKKEFSVMIQKTDFLVIGSGLAGLSFALKAAGHGKVMVITKKKIQKTNTALAQGGVAAVFSEKDSFDLHTTDTLNAGDGLCNEEVARMVVTSGPERIRELVSLGATFNKKGDGQYDFALGQEGGHSAKRIVYAHDLTGKEIEDTLVKKVREHPNVTILENHIAVNLITYSSSLRSGLLTTHQEHACCGVYVLNNTTGKVETVRAGITLLATGGAGKVYLYTSNPDIATGDGIAMAYRAGASVANLEFVQFHPTCLFHAEAKNFLISEAVRGEGAKLIDSKGRSFMHKYSKDQELACRDVVARAIDSELKKSGDESVFLDISHKDPEFIKNRFPNIYGRCLALGIDMTKDPIPVVPAAHYICGGVATDLNGQTDVSRLYAVGEVACTGLHGANRLASNSLLEALVYSDRAYKKAIEEFETLDSSKIPELSDWDETGTTDSDEAIVVSHNWDEIRRLMWNYVGIVRSDKRLERALRRIQNIKEEINEYYWDFKIGSDLIELRNIATVAELIIRCALMRKESRGLHYNIEYPEKDNINWLKHTIIHKKI